MRFIYGAQYGSKFNRETRITKPSQVEQFLLDIKSDVRKFEPQNVRNEFLFQRDYCTKVVHTNENFALFLTSPQNEKSITN